MAKQKVSKVQFMDGALVDAVVTLFLAGDLASGNYNLTRLFVMKNDGNWFHWDFGSVVVSVCAMGEPRRLFAMGRDGKIWYKGSGVDPVEECIADAGTGKGKYGYLTQIRAVAGDVYACGDGGQVYKRTAQGWRHIDEGVLEKGHVDKPNCHNGIDGTGPTDIYVVGEYGRIFHFNGKRWENVSFATNSHLERVRCKSPDEVYICGGNGTLLQGNRHGWEMIGDTEMVDHIWDLEVFNGKIYLAVEDTIMVYEKGEVHRVDTKLRPPIDAYHWGSRVGMLWSFGENDLAHYDGERWVRVIHPDNL
jgi:photosystem II stability/assembly factor-like uncharacterized protein